MKEGSWVLSKGFTVQGVGLGCSGLGLEVSAVG